MSSTPPQKPCYLTGLPLEAGFREAVSNLLSSADSGLMVMGLVDIDRFRMVMHHHGPDYSDRLLQAVAAVLKSSVPEPGLVARLRSDHFLFAFIAAAEHLLDTFAEDLQRDLRLILDAVEEPGEDTTRWAVFQMPTSTLCIASAPLPGPHLYEHLYAAVEEGHNWGKLKGGNCVVVRTLPSVAEM